VPLRSPQSNAADSISPAISRGQCREPVQKRVDRFRPESPDSPQQVLCYVSASGDKVT
jgi:hypothetical protein